MGASETSIELARGVIEISRSDGVERERSWAPSGSYSLEKDFRGLRVQLAQCCVVRSREALIVGKARRSLGRRGESLVRPATCPRPPCCT
jgi:hypothetical protein